MEIERKRVDGFDFKAEQRSGNPVLWKRRTLLLFIICIRLPHLIYSRINIKNHPSFRQQSVFPPIHRIQKSDQRGREKTKGTHLSFLCAPPATMENYGVVVLKSGPRTASPELIYFILSLSGKSFTMCGWPYRRFKALAPSLSRQFNFSPGLMHSLCNSERMYKSLR